MYLDFLLEKFEKNRANTAIVWKEEEYSYEWLLEKYNEARDYLKENEITTGEIVAIRADFNPYSIPFFLALIG